MANNKLVPGTLAFNPLFELGVRVGIFCIHRSETWMVLNNVHARADGEPCRFPADPDRSHTPDCYWVTMTLLFVAGSRKGELSTSSYPECSFDDWLMWHGGELLSSGVLPSVPTI